MTPFTFTNMQSVKPIFVQTTNCFHKIYIQPSAISSVLKHKVRKHRNIFDSYFSSFVRVKNLLLLFIRIFFKMSHTFDIWYLVIIISIKKSKHIYGYFVETEGVLLICTAPMHNVLRDVKAKWLLQWMQHEIRKYYG